LIYCFDVDGTLEVSNGPIKLDVLKQLLETDLVFIVSPSWMKVIEKANIPIFMLGENRIERLKLVRKKFPHETVVYIGDTLGDKEAAKQAEVGFIYAKDFKMNNL